MASTALELISQLCGWGYVVCWGVSLYPPILLNHRNKSVEGMAVDFVYLNFWGCIFYLLSVSMLYFSTTVRLEHALAHAGEAHGVKAAPKQPLVRLNDVIYGCHSLVLVVTLLCQFYLLGYRKTAAQTLSRTVKLLSLAGVIGALLLLLHGYEISTTRRHYQLVDVANIFGTVKVFLSTVKYVPQAYFNYQRRSVKGFAMKGCFTDILGGILCASQLLVDGYLAHDIRGAFKHPTKLMLAGVTMFFGIVFLTQYKLFSNNDPEPSIYNEAKTKAQ